MYSRLSFFALAFAVVLALPNTSLAQPDIYVDADATVSGCGSASSISDLDGSSWDCAYPALQDAFDEVNNSSFSTSFEIWVAGGTYYPDVDNVDNNGDASTEHSAESRSESFTLIRDDVAFYGGFDGTDGSGGGTQESNRSDRDPEAYPVTLSGDVDEDNSSAGNAYHVVYLDGRTGTGTTLTSTTVIDGLTVTGGNANGSSPNNRGGGLYCDGSDDGTGGGDECSPVLQRLTFENNRTGNTGFGGAIYVDAEGGMASPTIRASSFLQNTSQDGGAIFNNGDPGTANGEIVNATFFGNGAGNGGAIFNDADNGTASLSIINATFAGNTASGSVSGGKGGSAIITRGADLELRNSIVWDHTSYSVYEGGSGQPIIAHSLVEGGQGAVSNGGVGGSIDYHSSNLDANPRYLGSNRGAGSDGSWGTSDDNLQRNWASAAIDNGDVSVVPTDVTDIDGDGNTSELVPDQDLTDRNQGKTVDIGAYERGGVAPTGGVAHVDQGASGDMDGTDWTNAYTDLQAGLRANENAQASATPGDVTEVQVATGTYTPSRRRDATDVRSRTFYIDGDNVEVYAGYPSGGGTRDPEANPVVLSGDLDGDDDPYAPQSDTDGDGTTPSQTDHLKNANAYSVLFLDAVSTDITGSTILNGLTVTGGLANGGGTPADRGGGLFCRAGSGRTCSPTLSGVSFYGNHAATAGGAIYNGAEGTANFSAESVVFRGNATGGNGGAIANDAQNGTGTVSPSLTNATVIANAALGDGGGIWNHAASSGETASPSITNVSFTGNTAGGSGGTLYGESTDGTVSPTVANSILWGNGIEVAGSYSTLTIDHSIVEGGCPSQANCTGNLLDQNPQFANPDGSDNVLGTADDDLRLQGPGSSGGASPAIDAGNNDEIAVSQDLGGNPRPQDVPSVTDTGSPAGDAPYVDMGAFESNGDALPVEFTNVSGQVEEQDAVIKWSTASETNNAGFEVQRRVSDASTPGARKTDGSFTSLDGAFVEGAGTTNEPQSYSYRVEDLDAGTHTFRLKQVDTDGSASYSDPIEVDVGLDGPYSFAAYPNPVRQQATVEFAMKEKADVTIALYNTLGQRVQTLYRGSTPAEQTRRVSVDAATLSSGVYFVRMRGGGVTATKRITVVR
ncbi:hypothetical protein BSZ35_11175 [Salinibacter sp. 10B]|uniref:T9SS type A sorting domain-containing protein n=1 Tax=Salinibacter sp. 10B TaxID=1923971 RepID=UPI000CF50A9D|nr:T9SS type A sorting domain-containing protein [Salinibacter sp. 10B]PQJ35083.1 hypothetical protein BSZ35_11175 [Salinibacter sp. 10B]